MEMARLCSYFDSFCDGRNVIGMEIKQKVRQYTRAFFSDFKSIFLLLFGIVNLIGSIITLLWCSIVAYFCSESDFWTKILPENEDYWKDKVAWITGASDGIGKAIAKELSLKHCRLIISSRRAECLEKVRDEIIAICEKKSIRLGKQDFLLLPFDMSDKEAISKAVDQAVSWKGGVSFLFSNAGVGVRGIMLSADVEEKAIDIDLCSHMCITKKILPSMIKNGFGHIIYTNSVQGRIALPGSASYATAKAALLAYAYALKRECVGKRQCIYFTSLMAGFVATRIGGRCLTSDGEPSKVVDFVSERHRNGMSPQRFAQIALSGASNQLSECWIAKLPELYFLYLQYYLPSWFSFMVDVNTPKLVERAEKDVEEFRERRSKEL